MTSLLQIQSHWALGFNKFWGYAIQSRAGGLEISFSELPGDPEWSKQTQRWLWSWLESLPEGTAVRTEVLDLHSA